MNTKSTDSLSRSISRASPCLMSSRDGARSNPIGSRPMSRHTSIVVPLPTIGSITTSPSRVYR